MNREILRWLNFGAIAATWLLAATSLAAAAPLTRQFTGSITSVGSAATALGISVGDPISGSFTWDSTTLTGSPFLGGLFAYQKASPIAPNSLNVTIGSFVVPAMTGEGFSVFVGDDATPPVVASKMDMVAVSRAIGFGSEVPGQVSGIAVAFGDSDLAHLTGNALPTEAQMANFETGQLTLTIGPPLTSGGAAVGSIQLVPVPEPGTLTLSLAAGIVLLGCVARRRAA